MTTQATKASEQKNKKQNSQPKHNELDNRYGKIGISAVAAAVRHQGEQRPPASYRIPYDRD